MRRLLPLFLLLLLVPAAPAAAATPAPLRPVVFVHGSAGSAAQFATQAKRLAANGYPIEIIEAHEYDSPNIATILPAVYAGLDARIERLLARTGADGVDLIAHSLGTFVSQGYLSSPARAARVAHYVNLDGRTAAAPPGGVPTLAIWGEGDPARAVTGGLNVHFPGQSHTQTVSSAESFREMYRFLRGSAPRTTAVVPTPVAQVSGRSVIFPSNAGSGGTVLVHPLDPVTGRRLASRPQHSVAVAADGSFGPVSLSPVARYEFVLQRPGTPAHHFYFQPFLRSDSLVRLLAGRPGEGVGALIETSEQHTALTLNRQKEWWGDQGDQGDQIWINGRQILNAANAPRSKRVIGVFAFDKGSDRVTDLTAPLPEFYAQTFLTGMDVFIPAGPLAAVVVAHRGGGLETTTLPAWPSSEHRVTVNVNDY
jgi:hypothetical protein